MKKIIIALAGACAVLFSISSVADYVADGYLQRVVKQPVKYELTGQVASDFKTQAKFLKMLRMNGSVIILTSSEAKTVLTKLGYKLSSDSANMKADKRYVVRFIGTKNVLLVPITKKT